MKGGCGGSEGCVVRGGCGGSEGGVVRGECSEGWV